MPTQKDIVFDKAILAIVIRRKGGKNQRKGTIMTLLVATDF